MRRSTAERMNALYSFLLNNYVPGRFFSIEEVVAGVTYSDGTPCYVLNTNPYIHDKCAVLSNDVRSWNWSASHGYYIIVKDTLGGVKLCGSSSEFEVWREKELAPIVKKCKYLNNLKYAVSIDSTVNVIDDLDINTLYK